MALCPCVVGWAFEALYNAEICLIWSGLSGLVCDASILTFFFFSYKQTVQSGFFVAESEAAADAWVKRILEALHQRQQQQQHLSPNLNSGSGYVERRGREPFQ